MISTIPNLYVKINCGSKTEDCRLYSTQVLLKCKRQKQEGKNRDSEKNVSSIYLYTQRHIYSHKGTIQ